MAEDFRDALRAMLGNADLPAGEDSAKDITEADTSAYARTRLDIFFEKKGRGGKKATIVSGFPEGMSHEEIAELASQLKQKLGAGGSSRGGEILIQGDRRADLQKVLELVGWKSRVC